MKNWIIALAVLILPLATYYVLEKTNNSTAIEAQAKDSSLPSIIKFASPMCLDCKKLDAVMLEVMPKYEGKINYQKIDTQLNDSNTTAMIKKYNVTLVPTMIFEKKDGTVYKRTEGYLNKKEVESILNNLTK